MHIKTGLVVSLFGALLLTGCASTTTPTPSATITVTATQPPKVLIFNPATSGKLLAARVVSRAKAAGIAATQVECRNFPDIRVGTHADCQMRVKGVKQGLRATFTQKDGHYVLKSQKLTW